MLIITLIVKNTAIGARPMKKNILIAAATFVALMSAYFLWSQVITSQIVNVADQFKAPSSWKLASEDIQVESLFCYNGGSCPEISRQWTLEKPITPDDFRQILQNSGWNFEVEGDCILPEGRYGPTSICSAQGQTDNYDIWININEDSTSHKQTAGIDVRPL